MIRNTENKESYGGGFLLFAKLIHKLGTTTKTNDKLAALVEYFNVAESCDKVWLIALFSGRKPARIASGSVLSTWCCEISDLPSWLFDECYQVVGDLGETIALLLPPHNENDFIHGSLSFYMDEIISLQKADEQQKRSFVTGAWVKMNTRQRFVFNKLLTGVFRIGISQRTITNALAKSTGCSPAEMAHKISGNWDPVSTNFEELIGGDSINADFSKPYPFYLAHALPGTPQELGAEENWQAEWKWDGIRGQIIKRGDELFVWSRGEELLTEKFPEFFVLKDKLPNGTVVDGEIIPVKNGEVLPFYVLQTRIGRKNITRKNLEEAPMGFIAYDIMEWEGEDIREKPLTERRRLLEDLVAQMGLEQILISPVIHFKNWQDLSEVRKESRSRNAEGLMLKRKPSAYGTGRKTGDWWKWKINPFTIDAVMIYAQKGHGRRSNLYTDYTFAVREGEKLVPFAKAYSGLTDKEIAAVDSFVKRNSIEKFGPVRTVKPEMVFEIAFEGIAKSNRHKSGVAVRFPRINRWRKDKPAEEINTLDDLRDLLDVYGK